MADYTALRGGQINGSGSADALFLKVFGGMVMTQFLAATIFRNLQTVRTITSGKSAQFPVLGNIVASRHTPGTEILGQTANQNEKIITIDDLLIAPVFIPNIDEAKTHYDIRGPYAQRCGYELAKVYDQISAQVIILAARAASTITGGNGGSVLTDANAGTVSANLKAQLAAAAQKLDEKNVPDTDRFVTLRPAQYWLLVNDGVTSSIANRDVGGVGSVATGKFPEWAGLSIQKSNNVPNTNVTTGITFDNNNTYGGNFSTTVCPVFHKSAIGTVELVGVSTEMEKTVRYQGTLVVAKVATGTGILRPESAVEIKTA
jgi:hypothetical protein